MPSLVVEPGVPYFQLAGRLRALDFTWVRETQTPPTISGEPEAVLWEHEASETRVMYTFNPVVSLRVLDFSGPEAPHQRARVASFLPHLTVDHVADFIREERIEVCLLGLFAAHELGLSMLLPVVHQRTNDADKLIADVAAEVENALAVLPLEHAREVVAKLSLGASPEPFVMLGDAPLRRQLLRQVATLDAASRPGLEWLLRSGLRDADAEVRASALLLCARRGLTSERNTIRTLDFTTPTDLGFDVATLDQLRRLQRVALELLDGRSVASLDERDVHVANCILGHEDGQFDAAFLLAFSLTTPLVLAGPESLPAHIERTNTGYALARSKLELSYVAPVPCWLGEPEAGARGANPLRRIVPQSSFFILRHALTPGTLQAVFTRVGEPDLAKRWLDAAHPELRDATTLAVTMSDALAIAEVLSRIEGAPVDLPGPDQWEMAARGPDARRYPWGNLRESNPQSRPSVWSAVGMTGGLAEWAKSKHGEPTACGGAALTCHARRLAAATELLSLRPITL